MSELKHQHGRAGRRIITEHNHKQTEEVLAENEVLQFARAELHHADNWTLGANVGAVFAGIGVLLLFAGIVPVHWTLTSFATVVVGLAITFGVGALIPPALTAAFGVWLNFWTLRQQQNAIIAAVLQAERARLRASTDVDVEAVDGEVRILGQEQKLENRQLAQAVKRETDLSQFVAGVFGRGEPLSFRHWQKRQWPSGRALTHSRWRDELLSPLLAVGAISEPQAKGQPYTAHKLPLEFVEGKLRRIGRLPD
jgi:hypothetical protein